VLPTNIYMRIRRWATMDARGYDGPGHALASLPFISIKKWIQGDGLCGYIRGPLRGPLSFTICRHLTTVVAHQFPAKPSFLKQFLHQVNGALNIFPSTFFGIVAAKRCETT